MTLGEALKRIRKEYKLTQEDVAKLVGVTRSGYTYYETGGTIPSIEVLKRLSAVYKTSIDDIIGNNIDSGKGKLMSANEEKKDPLMFMDKEERTLVMAYRLLSNQEKQELRKAVDEIVAAKNAKKRQE